MKIHSTNFLERHNGEIKRRAYVVGIFPDENTIRRLVGEAAERAERRMRGPEALHDSRIAGAVERGAAPRR